MGTTAEKLQAVLDSKAAIKAALSAGGAVSGAKLSNGTRLVIK